MDGSIEYVPEYLVVFNKFVELAKEYDLKLEKRENFHSFYQTSIETPRNKDLFNKIVNPDSFIGKIDQKQLDDQWDICNLYMVFRFKKVSRERTVVGTQGRCGRDREDRFKFIDTNR